MNCLRYLLFVLVGCVYSTYIMTMSVQELVSAAKIAQQDSDYVLDYANAKKAKSIINDLQEGLAQAKNIKASIASEAQDLQNARDMLARLLVSKVVLWNAYQQIFNDGALQIEITVDNRPFIEIQKELERQIGEWIGERVSVSLAQSSQAGKIASGALGALKQVGQKLNLAKNQIIEGLALPKEYGSQTHKNNVAAYFKAIELYVLDQDNPRTLERISEIFEDDLTAQSNHQLKKLRGSLQNYLELRAQERKELKNLERDTKKDELIAEAESLIAAYKGGYEDVEKRDAVLEKMRTIKEELSAEQFADDKRMQKRVELLQLGIDTIRALYNRMTAYCKATLVAPVKNKVLGLLTSDTLFDMLKPRNAQECSSDHKKILTGYLDTVYHYAVVLVPLSSDDPSHVRESIDSTMFEYIKNQKNLTDKEKIIKEIKGIVPEFIR